MRLLIAGIAALAAVCFAAPSFAQDDSAPAPVPVTKSKPKVGTTAYCNSLKTSSQKNSCLKRMQTAKVTKSHSKTAAKTKKPSSTPAPAASTGAESYAPPPAAATGTPSNSSVAVPPLPQKTI